MLSFIQENKLATSLAAAYVLFQLLGIWIYDVSTLFIYLVCYLLLIVVLSVQLIQGTKDLAQMIKFLGVPNLVLFLIYIPLFLLNPDINWYLRGENSFDPNLMYIAVPVVLFVLGILILSLVNIGYKLFASS